MIISESLLLKISLAGSIIGLILLFIFASNMEAKEIAIGKIDKSFDGKYVNITGVASGIKKTDTGLFFNLMEGEKKIRVVVWNSILEQFELLSGIKAAEIKDGAKISLVGIVQIYKGSLEVVPVRGEVKIIPNSK